MPGSDPRGLQRAVTCVRAKQDMSQAWPAEQNTVDREERVWEGPRLCPNLSFTQVGDLSDGHHSYVLATRQVQARQEGTRTHFCALGSGGWAAAWRKWRGERRGNSGVGLVTMSQPLLTLAQHGTYGLDSRYSLAQPGCDL